MPVSPRTQMMMEDEGGGDPQEIFEQSFQELAFNQLATKAPEIIESVVSFKVHEADPKANHAIGAFILDRGGEEIHVPAIFADNEVMPFDTMYVKSLDQMLPLNDQWLIEVENVGEASMGEAMKAPETLSSDVDIRNIVVPPTTGRYSYASTDLRNNLPAYLSEASNGVKVAFVETLRRHPHLAKFAFQVYGVNTIRKAVTLRAPQFTKKAAPTVSFMTMETPAEVIKEKAQGNSANVFRTIAEQGYATYDARPEEDKAVMYETETPLVLTVPSDTGYYRIYRTDGKTQIALIFGKILTENSLRYGKGVEGKADYDNRSKSSSVCRVGITEDNELFQTDLDFVAEPVSQDEVPEKLWNLVTKPTSTKPKNNQRGVFYNPDPAELVALEAINVERTWSTDGSRYAEGQMYSGNRVTVQQIADSPVQQPRLLIGGRTSGGEPREDYIPYSFSNDGERDFDASTLLLVPEDWAFLPVKKVLSANELVTDPEDVMSSHFQTLRSKGAQDLRLKNAGAGLMYVNGAQLNKLATLKHLVLDYHVSVPDAEFAVKMAMERDYADFFVITRQKLAESAGPPPEEAPPEEAPPAEEGMPPEEEMVGPDGMPMDPMMDPMMDPSMMAPPPPPNPVEMAAQEIADQLAEQNALIMQQLAQEQQNIQTQMSAIQAVVGRANEIAMETGLMPPEVVPPAMEMMDPSMLADAGMDPGGMPTSETDPAGSQLMAERGGMYPGETGNEGELVNGGAGVDPGMDPGMGPGMAPGESGPMGPEGMPVEEPGMMEEAMALEDPDMFDSAAIASLAESNNFDNTVAGFLPAIRESLDALGRMLTEVRMKAPVLRERVGDGTYNEVRDKLESLFEGMGDTILRVNAIVASDEDVDAPA